MKQKDREIIECMRQGKRLNISLVARRLHLPISTVSDAVRRIEKKYVTKRPSLLDYTNLGYLANARFIVKIKHPQKREFLEFLKSQKCVNSIYHINSGFDFLVDAVFRNAVEMKSWAEKAGTDFGAEITTFHILKVVETERFVP